ncbi:MAG TPA: DUF3038 domain-containing protein [Oscillatoriaceae cyanobacterium M33_DOE_052]|uniref:DUF3038 domain-containing protein n=1 Tax=Planktothricoides sp. SpSt-374 TaxID=2282167 RepID=A0A7C3VH34_9CYAN|nr:DUF3038 domain-containing protein [Oscillatoriaceae cyanobacterium M33_DOE_052]
MKNYLNLVLLALESLADIGSQAIITTAVTLNVEGPVISAIQNPNEVEIDPAQTEAIASICSYLAQQNQELIRRAVEAAEQLTQQNRPLDDIPLIGDYLDKFCQKYTRTFAQPEGSDEHISPNQLTDLALKLLVDLLFYSSPLGFKRLCHTLEST